MNPLNRLFTNYGRDEDELDSFFYSFKARYYPRSSSSSSSIIKSSKNLEYSRKGNLSNKNYLSTFRLNCGNTRISMRRCVPLSVGWFVCHSIMLPLIGILSAVFGHVPTHIFFPRTKVRNIIKGGSHHLKNVNALMMMMKAASLVWAGAVEKIWHGWSHWPLFRVTKAFLFFFWPTGWHAIWKITYISGFFSS